MIDKSLPPHKDPFHIKALIDRENKLIMDWSAKAGCTVCVRMFFKHMDLLDEALKYDDWIHRYRREVFSKEHPLAIDDLRDPSFFKFKIVRNPYNRVVSSFIHAMRFGYENEKIRKGLLLQSADISFHQFVEYLKTLDIKSCNPHHRLQREWFENESTFDKVGKLENLDEDIGVVNKLTGANLSPSDKSSPHHAKKSDNCTGKVAYSSWSAIQDKIPSYGYFYTNELIEQVNSIYREDFETYGYSFEDFLKNEKQPFNQNQSFNYFSKSEEVHMPKPEKLNQSEDSNNDLRKQLEEEYKFTIYDLKEQVRQKNVHNEGLLNENQELHLRIRELRKQLGEEQLKEREIKKKDYTIHNLQCDIEELRNESRHLRKSFSFRFGWAVTAPFRFVYEFSRRKKLVVYFKGVVLFLGKPASMLRSINRRNFKVLLYAIKTEPPGQIISNMKKMMNDPKKASKEAANELQNSPGTHTAGRSAIDLAIAENADAHVFLDDCTVMENRVQISGWALSKHGVKTIEVFLNGEFLGSARHGQRRPDLKKVFPGIKNAENSGFTFNRIHQPGTSAENAGKIEVIVRVSDNKNGKNQISKKVPLLKNDINLIKPDKITLDEDIKILTDQKAIEQTDVSVSVVIPTKNAGPEFDNLIKTLINQKGFNEIEVIIVDSGSTDETVAIAKRHGVNVVKIKPEEFTHSYARNLGAEQAKNDFLFFTVQDAMPSSLYFLYLMHYRLKREGVEVVTCTETPRADSDLFYRVTNRNHYRFLDVINQDKLFTYPGTDDHITLRKNAQLSDIGLLIKRELFMKYKYRLDYGEDLDLGMRLVKDGHTLLYAGTVKIIHSHKRVPYYYLRRGLVDSLYLKIRFKDFQYPNVKLEDVILEIPALYNELIHIIENKLEKLDDFTDHEQLDCTQELEAFQYKPAVRTTMLRKSEIVDDETYDFISELNEKAGQIDAENYNSNKMVVAGMINYSHILNTYMLDHYSRISNETIREYANALIRIFALLTGAYMGYCYLNDSDNPAAIEIYKKLKMNV